MELQAEEKPQQIEKEELSSADQTFPAEKAISLNKLYPKVKQDLDALFPEPTMKKLLRDVVRTKQRNEGFLKRMDFKRVDVEEGDETADTP